MTRVFSRKRELGVRTPSIRLITFADDNYSRSAESLCQQAINCDFDRATFFSPADVDSEFTQKHAKTFAHKRGVGYWLWKPFIIQDSLQRLADNDILLYLDAGIMLRKPAQYFRELAQKSEITLWQENTKFLTNNYWIDEKVWLSVIRSSDGYHDDHFIAGAILIRNSKTARTLVNSWLSLCTQPSLLHPDSATDYKFTGSLIGHRHDQSLLNCILHSSPQFFNPIKFSNTDNFPFLIHRRGNVRSLLHAQFLQILKVGYRLTLSFLPKFLRITILTRITKRRKPTLSEGEVRRHQNTIFS